MKTELLFKFHKRLLKSKNRVRWQHFTCSAPIHYLKQWPNGLTHICVTKLNELRDIYMCVTVNSTKTDNCIYKMPYIQLKCQISLYYFSYQPQNTCCWEKMQALWRHRRRKTFPLNVWYEYGRKRIFLSENLSSLCWVYSSEQWREILPHFE